MIGSARLFRLGVGVAAAALISGCATSNNPKDPFEGYNRAMFSFNEAVDTVALKPAATVYKEALPDLVQTGIGNFFGNIGDVWSAANNLLQGNGEAGMSDVARVMINTMFGLLGVIDVASDAGLPKHQEDFGQTLGKWGVESGPYVVLPLLGSSTMRDTVALPVDVVADPWGYVDPANVRNIGLATRIVDQRAAALSASTLVEEASLDKYEFVRDAFLQRRQGMVERNGKQYSGKAKQDTGDDDWVTVSDDQDKLSDTDSVSQKEAASRGSAARAVFTFGSRPR